MLRLRTRSTLFPYTTLFRSYSGHGGRRRLHERRLPRCGVRRSRDGSHHDGREGQAQAAAAQADLVQVSIVQPGDRSEEHTSELQSLTNLVCRLLLEKKNK